jgi:2-phospho-L-lactate guanylyltransferase
MKPASQSKSRLASALNTEERAILSINMLHNVVRAAVESSLDRVIVLGGDCEIREIAKKRGANWRPDEGRGLNGELSAQIEANSTSGAASVYIPADLVLLKSEDVDQALESSMNGTLLTMCPALGDGGTNGLVIPAASPFQLQLGTDSFNKHKAFAGSLSLPYSVVETPGFGLDLDTAEDLEVLRRTEPGVLERMLQPGEIN